MSLSEMASTKAQLEASLRDLRRQLEKTRQEVAMLTATSTSVEEKARINSLLEKAQRTAVEVERRKLQIENLNQQMAWSGAGRGTRENWEWGRDEELLQADIDALRTSILATLRSLARSLRRYEDLVNRKTNLTTRASAYTHRDLSYANYVDCALVRRQEYDDDLRYVLEYLHRTRVVS